MDKKIKSKTGSKDWLYADLNATILNAAREVHNRFTRLAYSEENYREALARELRARDQTVQIQVRRPRVYKSNAVGESVADLVVDDKVVILIKTTRQIAREHLDLLRTYLHDGSWRVGLVIAFSRNDLTFRRLDEPVPSPFNHLSGKE